MISGKANEGDVGLELFSEKQSISNQKRQKMAINLSHTHIFVVVVKLF